MYFNIIVVIIIHNICCVQKYLNGGAHVISTNTFNSTSLSQEDYGLQDLAYELNFAAATIAKECTTQVSTTLLCVRSPLVFLPTGASSHLI